MGLVNSYQLSAVRGIEKAASYQLPEICLATSYQLPEEILKAVSYQLSAFRNKCQDTDLHEHQHETAKTSKSLNTSIKVEVENMLMIKNLNNQLPLPGRSAAKIPPLLGGGRVGGET